MLTSCPWKGRCAWVALLAALVAGCAAPAPDPGGGRAEARRILQEAQVTAVGIEDAEFKSVALFVIAGWQATAGDIAGARLTAAAILDAERKASALHAIAGAQAQAGDRAGAARTLEGALDAAAVIPKPESLFEDLLAKAAFIALLAADRVDAGDLAGTLAWAAAHRDDAVARAAALVGAAVAILEPGQRPGSRDDDELFPPGFRKDPAS